MNSPNELTLEQEFKLEIHRQKLQELNPEESKVYLIAALKQMMIKDNVIKFFIKNSNL